MYTFAIMYSLLSPTGDIINFETNDVVAMDPARLADEGQITRAQLTAPGGRDRTVRYLARLEHIGGASLNANYHPAAKSLIYGLSDFWTMHFKELPTPSARSHVGVGDRRRQSYLDSRSPPLLNNSTQDAAVVLTRSTSGCCACAEDHRHVMATTCATASRAGSGRCRRGRPSTT